MGHKTISDDISPDIFQTHTTVPFDNVVTEHHPIVQCARGKHQQVMASSGCLRIGGAGQTCAACLRLIEIADADAHDDKDDSRSRVAVVQWDCPRFESPVTGTCDRSRSVKEEARAFNFGW